MEQRKSFQQMVVEKLNIHMQKNNNNNNNKARYQFKEINAMNMGFSRQTIINSNVNVVTLQTGGFFVVVTLS